MNITLTLPEELVAAVDRYVEEHDGSTRSEVCAQALREWLRTRQEEEIAGYYLSMSDEQRAEDAAWSAVSAASIQP